MPLWIILVLVNVLCISFFYLLTKKLLNEENDPILYGGMMQLLTAVFAGIIVLFTGFHFTFSPQSITFLIIEGLLYAIAAPLYYSGLRHVDLSKSIVFESSAAFWALFLGTFFLHENLTVLKVIGTSCIFVGILFVSLKRSIDVRFTKYDLMILVSAIFYALGAVTDKYLVGYGEPSSYLMLAFFVPGAMILTTNWFRLKTIGVTMLKKKSFQKLLILSSISVTLAYTALFSAYKIGGDVSAVYPLSQTQVIIISLFGIIFLKERTHIPQKALAALCTIAGLILLGM